LFNKKIVEDLLKKQEQEKQDQQNKDQESDQDKKDQETPARGPANPSTGSLTVGSSESNLSVSPLVLITTNETAGPVGR
ncbi:MAG: hypothetical protein JKY10_11990, partial [Cohaesibacteraceae bacterium]|nr:hypothetical protein [Cohaesibacteraceae bacterium]